MLNNIPRTRQKSRNKPATQGGGKPLSGSATRALNPLVRRKNLETPQQKFERLLAEGHRPHRKQLSHGNSDTSTQLEVVSPEGAVEILWEPHQEARSGAFTALVVNKSHRIEAKLEDEADSQIHTFSEQGKVTTHVLPLGDIGDTAYFDAVNETTGECAVAKATTYGTSAPGSIGSWIKSLFS